MMLSAKKRIDCAYQSALELTINDSSRIAIMSDCHRGDGSRADDFAKNKIAYLAALQYYESLSYTYIELGDGEELWENRSFSEISSVHSDVYEHLSRFYRKQRLFMIYGNHDLEKRDRPALFNTYDDKRSRQAVPLFPGARFYEGIRLKHDPTEKELFLVHGHQADFLNSELWQLARFLVRRVWKPLEIIGFEDPTRAATNNKVKDKVERRLTDWARERNVPLVAGHTHRPVFPEPEEGKYFNDGCCVHPWSITAIEIVFGEIALVKWSQKTNDKGAIYIGKDLLAGPRKLTAYFM